jgi:hypothetical protein
MKYLAPVILAVIFSQVTYGQDAYNRFFQALIAGDSILAAQIEKDNAYETEPIEEAPFPIRNIPEHVFPFGITQLRDTIIALFSIENQLDNKILTKTFYDYMAEADTTEENKFSMPFNAETVKDSLFGRWYFSKQNTSNDIYIHNFGVAWPSRLYFSKGKPLQYRTAFIIKVFKATTDSTRVLIIAENTKVINGINGFGVHGPIARETSVDSSSIEEYSLLLFIADKLKENNLPPLKLPKRN